MASDLGVLIQVLQALPQWQQKDKIIHKKQQL